MVPGPGAEPRGAAPRAVVPPRAGAGSAAPFMNAPPAPAVPAFVGPRLVKLNDIKEYFPVVWRKVDGRPGKSTYAIELFGKKITEMSRAVGHDVRKEVTDNLLAALRASNSWTVLAPVEREVCRIEIK